MARWICLTNATATAYLAARLGQDLMGRPEAEVFAALGGPSDLTELLVEARALSTRQHARRLVFFAAAEHRELAAIYVGRGLTTALARDVATQLMAHDALGAHMRDELGLTETGAARPLQAALSSAASFAAGAAWPLLVALVAPRAALVPMVAGASLLALAALGALAARAGGADMAKGAARVTLWGALAMAVTAGVGLLVGQAV